MVDGSAILSSHENRVRFYSFWIGAPQFFMNSLSYFLSNQNPMCQGRNGSHWDVTSEQSAHCARNQDREVCAKAVWNSSLAISDDRKTYRIEFFPRVYRCLLMPVALVVDSSAFYWRNPKRQLKSDLNGKFERFMKDTVISALFFLCSRAIFSSDCSICYLTSMISTVWVGRGSGYWFSARSCHCTWGSDRKTIELVFTLFLRGQTWKRVDYAFQ